MRGTMMFVALAVAVGGAVGCGHETRTVVRRETVQTETIPAPVVERHTIIEAPAAPQQRVIEEKRTVIEHE